MKDGLNIPTESLLLPLQGCFSEDPLIFTQITERIMFQTFFSASFLLIKSFLWSLLPLKRWAHWHIETCCRFWAFFKLSHFYSSTCDMHKPGYNLSPPWYNLCRYRTQNYTNIFYSSSSLFSDTKITRNCFEVSTEMLNGFLIIIARSEKVEP